MAEFECSASARGNSAQAMADMSVEAEKSSCGGWETKRRGIQAPPHAAARIFGHVLRFKEQINLFNETARSIKRGFSSIESFDLYMSKSLFFIHIGSNDLGAYWKLGKRHKNATKYLLRLSKKLSDGLERMYKLGARKFLVNNVSPLGCWPFNLNTNKPKTCRVEDINQRVSSYNGVLRYTLKNLEAELKAPLLWFFLKIFMPSRLHMVSGMSEVFAVPIQLGMAQEHVLKVEFPAWIDKPSSSLTHSTRLRGFISCGSGASCWRTPSAPPTIC
ncbi:hypothetical protein F3Y22_tig00110020pilonHSYRG00010 [Hibiscus syriacus]|uniref:GDSL esterase/lipase n=1 Tax=Hibiscus syriacus TaxID=106335 RepID=A0A6A3BN39_HIBSY|nr:hypothetical protein F3Y22_tig00110020pilonHSYRG00010 [Hibiscus syriacus]